MCLFSLIFFEGELRMELVMKIAMFAAQIDQDWLLMILVCCEGASFSSVCVISIEEMEKALWLRSREPVLAKGCVCHTDGAETYRRPKYKRSAIVSQ